MFWVTKIGYLILNHDIRFSDQISRSVVSDSLWPHESQHARPPYPITNSRSSLKLTSIELVMPSSHLILCRPLFLLPPIPPSIRVFSNESTLCLTWPKYWSFSFSIIPSKELVHDKFKFCFLELSGFFFPNIFNLWFVESIDAEPVDMEGWLYIDGKEAY